MFLLDSLMISGLKWVMNTVVTAAEAEMNDDTALREQLLTAEMRRETGEISDQEFEDIEADLLTRIREIKERREGGSGPLSMGAQPIETTGDSTFRIEAEVTGDFHEPPSPAAAPPLVRDAASAEPTQARTRRTSRTSRTTRTNRTPAKSRTGKIRS